jgi:hypothetical protein
VAHSYDVYVAALSQTETHLASDYSFRSEQASVSTLAYANKYDNVGDALIEHFTVVAESGTDAGYLPDAPWHSPDTDSVSSDSGASPSDAGSTGAIPWPNAANRPTFSGHTLTYGPRSRSIRL